MINKSRLYIATFLSVAIIVFAIGYIGISLSLEYLQGKYIEIQLDANRRKAETFARMLEHELSYGLTPDSLVNKLQYSIEGTDTERGFLCMFDQDGAKLVCHPDPKMIGMPMPDNFRFDDMENKQLLEGQGIVGSDRAQGGLLHKGDQNTDITYMTPVKGTKWMLSVHENIAMIEAEIQKIRWAVTIGSIILGLLIALGASFAARRISWRYEKRIEAQNKQLESQQKGITDSIRYARRIQRALLPPTKNIEQWLPQHFIFFKPRDIVSGDFYWVHQTGKQVIIVAADCTGHGVPGAFMSMLGISFLNELVNKNKEDIVKENFTASEILNELRRKVKESLHQTGKRDEAKDGLDMALCILDPESLTLQYAGAHNPLYLIRNNELLRIKADKMPIGIYHREKKEFTNHLIQLQANDCLYLFSDGFIDQFGGENGRKYMSKNFQQLLLSIHQKPMREQKELLEDKFQKWMGEEYQQLDDVLVIGLCI